MRASVTDGRNPFLFKEFQTKVSKQPNVKIAPATGKLGILIPGMGAVATTFIAGVEAVKRGLGHPIGSLTQLSTIRLGKRTDNNTPKIKDFVPLTPLECLVFGTWDIFEDNAYEAAANAKVLEPALLEQLKEPLSAIKPMKAVFDKTYVKRIDGPNVKSAPTKMEHAEAVDAGHPGFQAQQQLLPSRDDLVRIDRGVPQAGSSSRHDRVL